MQKTTIEQERRRFVVSEKGRKVGVILWVRRYRELLDDMDDLAAIAERKAEPSEPFEAVKKRLEKKWGRTSLK